MFFALVSSATDDEREAEPVEEPVDGTRSTEARGVTLRPAVYGGATTTMTQVRYLTAFVETI